MAAATVSGVDVLGAEICVARLEPPTEATVARIRPALAAALAHSVRLPPLGLVADLVSLLEVSSPVLRGIEVPGLGLRRYDDRVIGPMVMHRRRMALTDAYAALPESWRGAAVAALAERVCEELDPDGGWWEPGALRGWMAKPDAEGIELGMAAIGDPEVHEVLQRRLTGMIARPPVDFTAADVHLVKNLPQLATRAQRLLVRQVLEASGVLGFGLVRSARPRIRPGPISTGMSDDDTYPAGGFSGLTTSGSPENLVASELVYMEDDRSTIDLFDVRFTEGELLYFTRDESNYLRQRRRVRIGLAADLVDARVKDPGVPWQRLVAVLGALHAVIERLVDWLGEQDLRIDIHPVPTWDGRTGSQAGDVLQTETDALSLVLRTWVDAGVVGIEPLEDGAAFAARVAESARVAETDVVWLSCKAPPPELAVPVQVLPLEIGRRRTDGWVDLARALAAHLT